MIMIDSKIFYFITLLSITLLFQGCQRNSNEVMEDSRTASRYVGQGFRVLAGKQGDSRQVHSREQFGFSDEFIALEDQSIDGELAVSEGFAQSTESPGDPGSVIPGIDGFSNPEEVGHLAGIFKNIQFPYDSNLVKGDENLRKIRLISNYLEKHPNTWIFIEGHCDDRGPQAYNLALGTRRSNAVRNLLIEYGANQEQLFTISYGKEKPIALGADLDSRSANRRAQFKVFSK